MAAAADTPTDAGLPEAPWLRAVTDRLATAWASGRFPHALLLQSRPGMGAEAVALGLARLVLCENPGPLPCGSCGSCRLFAVGNHPDLLRVAVEEDASFIKIEQIRGLAEWASLKSYRGTRKVAIIDPADKMFFNSFNALLKTLEEPPENAILFLVVTRPEKLPKTIISRCQRVVVEPPREAAALEWLHAIDPAIVWTPLLEMSAGAPFRCLELQAAGMTDLGRDLQGYLDAVAGGRAEPFRSAEAWSRDKPAERLVWLEFWAMRRARAAIGANGDGVDNNHSPSLPSGPGEPNIRACFDFVDRVREARNLLQGSLNTQLLLEGVALAAAELVRGRVPAGRERAR